jgi:ABC-type transport system involved in multi-copper enzyme maturation permease subunit
MSALRPLGFVATALESARQTALRLRHHRVWFLVIVGAAALYGIAWLVGNQTAKHGRGDGVMAYCNLAWWLQATVVMPWLTLYLGVQALHGGLEDRTFQYLFLRPVSRAGLLVGKWLAVAAVGGAVGAAGSCVLFAGMSDNADLWPDGADWSYAGVFAAASMAGAAAYAAVAMTFSAWFQRPLVWAALFVVGLQQVVANLPVSAGMRYATITDPMRRFVLDAIEPTKSLARSLWPAEPDFQIELVGAPLRDLAILAAVALALAAWIYSRTEYDARQRD